MDLLTLPYTSKSTGEFLTASWMANNTGPKTQCSFGQLLVVLFQYRGNRVEHMGISSLYSLHPTQLITPNLQHHLSLQMGFFSYSACKEPFSQGILVGLNSPPTLLPPQIWATWSHLREQRSTFIVNGVAVFCPFLFAECPQTMIFSNLAIIWSY